MPGSKSLRGVANSVAQQAGFSLEICAAALSKSAAARASTECEFQAPKGTVRVAYLQG